MPSAEARYVRMIGDYILDIMPESARRRRMVLAYVSDRIAAPPREAPASLEASDLTDDPQWAEEAPRRLAKGG